MNRADRAKEQWRRELPGNDFNTMALFGHLVEASHLAVRDVMEPLHAEVGLKYGEFDVLATLRRSGAPFTLMPADLLKTTMVSSGGMTARLNRLEKAGLIRRAPQPDDRRVLLVVLTEKGKQLVEELLPRHMAAQTAAVSGLAPEEQDQLRRLLGKLITSITDPGER